MPSTFFRQRRRLLMGLSSITLAGAWPGARAADGVEPGRIRLGMSAPFSGPTGAYGKQMQQGIESLFHSVNAEGGIGGRKLELVALDDGYEPGAAVANTKRLIEQERVFALLGFYGTASTTAVMPVLDQAGVPLIGTISGAESLRKPQHRHIFHLRASYGDETAAIVKNLTTVGVTRVAVLYQDDGFGKAGLDGVAAALGRLSLAPVASAPVPRNSVEVAAAVETLAKAQPQAVVMVTLFRPTAEFVKRMRLAGARPHFVALSPVGTDQLIETLGHDSSRGIEVSQVIPNPWSDRLEVTREYKRLQASQGHPEAVSYYGLEGYLNAKLVAAALRRAGASPTREGLMAALRGAPFDLGGYRVQFGETKNAGSSYVEISVIGADGRILT
jgi:ABC-type branched-subunit amino acid transport system substrate-binding protein